jgi:hypothetical protein
MDDPVLVKKKKGHAMTAFHGGRPAPWRDAAENASLRTVKGHTP